MNATTTSLCPVCLRRLPATVVARGDEVWLERSCPQHGDVRALVWRGPPDYEEWRRAGSGAEGGGPAENPDCPRACGLCEGHVRQTCCTLLEVTGRCDLQCPVCFAGAGRTAPADPSIGTIEGWYRRLLDIAPGGNVQLSGGEPTVRDDLPELIALGRSLGLPFFQLNSNGLRLAMEDGYATKLAAAGLGTVFLQFDGVDDDAHVALRGRPLAALKERAIERCAAAGIGIVLVPTVARDVNLGQLGRILDYALERLPAVRGVHLQPLALLGRYPDARAAAAARVTLPDAMRELAAQSGGRLHLDDFRPGDCEHALCSFSREYLRRGDGSLAPLGRRGSGVGSDGGSSGRRDGGSGDGRCVGAETDACGLSPLDKAEHVARRWSAPSAPLAQRDGAASSSCRCGSPVADDQWDEILRTIRGTTFSVSGMAFQDAWTTDVERLRHCYLHVLAGDGRVVPFCAYNLTGVDGRGLGIGRAPVEARTEARAPAPAEASAVGGGA